MKSNQLQAYQRIDNTIYDAPKDIWWNENEFLHLLKSSINPCRFQYFMRIYRNVLNQAPHHKTVLDVGCGGGILAESLAGEGFTVTGIDPSENSIQTAQAHAKLSDLAIHYVKGYAEQLPFDDQSFDAVFCCDVLEHVQDVEACIQELSRVLKPGGIFFFDTINRTFLSKLVMIKIWQEWKRYALVESSLHVYEMFIQPSELKMVCQEAGLPIQELKGMVSNMNPLRFLRLLRQRAKGKLTYKELGQQFQLIESKDLNVSYMGYSIKNSVYGQQFAVKKFTRSHVY